MSRSSSPPTLEVRGLTVEYQARRGKVQAVREVSFEVARGEALALIGESGSGKTTLGLSLVRLLPSAATVVGGQVLYRRSADAEAVDVLKLGGRALRRFRWSECAMVFQAALNAFNPVLRVSSHFGDTARAHGSPTGRALEQRGAQLLKMVRLDAERVWSAFPHELSGGMRQRVLIALSLLLEPQLLILDEPTTALDILTQRTVMDVLKELRTRLDFSLIFISHDLALAAELADSVATVYAGRIIERGPVEAIFGAPAHPYTIGLVSAVPTLADRREDLAAIPGSPPDLIDLPTGCKFHPRCPLASERCRVEDPPLLEVGPDQRAACWHWDQALAAGRTIYTLEERHG